MQHYKMMPIQLHLAGTGGSSWCKCKSDELQNRSKHVRTSVSLFCSLSDKYRWESYYPPSSTHSYGLNRTTTGLLYVWLWH